MARLNREFAMLAVEFVRAKHRSAGMYMSEKLDGHRALWIPATIGMNVKDIPFANRVKDKREHISTGLWSRYGKVIHCPPDFTAGFPDYPLDGELHAGRGAFQITSSVVKNMDASRAAEWRQIRYLIFDRPMYCQLFADGRINNAIYKHTMSLEQNMIVLRIGNELQLMPNFDDRYKLLNRDLVPTEFMRLHDQELLPFSTVAALARIEQKLNEIDAAGGEGLILRHPASKWEPIRSTFMYKVKTWLDSEGIVIGMKAGKEGIDGNLLGKMGSLRLRWTNPSGKDVEFDLSGFNYDERLLTEVAMVEALKNPGEKLLLEPWPSAIFKAGESVTFRYRELTDDGIPKEARYWRKYES